MEGLGSEVGSRMRSAVKAKLIELGSGTAGYIDDELPDYVMIMVANKRSKEQMTEDLSLFLGKNTDIFVSWLHQVLEKLQEVTLTTTADQPKSKRKTSESIDKREKKSKTKKRGAKDKNSESPKRSTTPPIQATPSITDVFADHLIQKAKTVIEPPLSVKKAERNNGITNDGFDIPTISEIANKTVRNVAGRKEITELAELQKKIDQAKRQLSHMANESDDDDFINLRADRIDFDADLSNNSKDSNSDDKSKENRKKNDSATKAVDNNNAKSHPKITFNEKKNEKRDKNEDNGDKDLSIKKRSILDRLGTKGQNEKNENKNEKNENIISLSAHRRMEQAIYVAPAQRRSEHSSIAVKKSDRDRSSERLSIKDSRENRSSNRSRDTNEPKDLRGKVRQRERDIELRGNRTDRTDRTRDRSSDEIPKSAQKNEMKLSIASRIGRIIVGKNKTDYIEDKIEVPVNSVVKVQPRPLIPKSNQASKNLLLRAVAEAQKSTALIKPTVHEFKSSERNTKELYTKSFRKNMQKSNIVVEIATNRTDNVIEVDDDDNTDNTAAADEEYVPTPISIEEEPFIYIPQAIHNSSYDDTSNDGFGTKTQFVVTLDSLDYRNKNHSPKMQRKDAISQLKRSTRLAIGQRLSKEPESKNLLVEQINQPNSVKNENELRKSIENKLAISRKRALARRIDNNTSEPANKQPKKIDRKSPEPDSKHDSKDENNGNRNDESIDGETNESSSKIRIRSSSQSKYDNLPPLSSAITVTTNEKVKEKRCKFYPSCTRGERCEYIHPSTPCKSFPNCVYGDHCLYIHPKCKFDLTCSRLNCNFNHTPVSSAAPPLASHVVPVTNYKKIVATPLPTLCRFYPNCSNTLCEFFHPKPCKFGKNCTNKIECNFYHYDLPPTINTALVPKNKMKWVASAT